MIVPASVSGRPVTNRGVHLQPGGNPSGWMVNPVQRQIFLDLLDRMHMSWCVMLTNSDACLEVFDGKEAVRWLLDIGVIPIIRDMLKLPTRFNNMESVARTVEIYAEYGLRPVWQLYNEPGDDREWEGNVPDDWFGIFMDRWKDAAKIVVGLGAIAGFPDGPCYSLNPFNSMTEDWFVDNWREGNIVYLGHHYGKGRPLDYPENDVCWFGTPLTQEERNKNLDEFAGLSNWDVPSLEMVNKQRKEWADPTATALKDDTCWLGWKIVQFRSRLTYGFNVQMAMTEGGWVPRDRAGSNPIDDRWDLTTPEMVAKKTLAMYQDAPPEMFAVCPWLLADSLMGGAGQFEDGAWYTGAWRPHYWLETPVIGMLEDNPPSPSLDCHALVLEKLDRIIVLLEEMAGL